MLCLQGLQKLYERWQTSQNKEKQKKSKEEVISDSTSWGNYSNATFEYVNSSGDTVTKTSSIRIPTGSTEYTKANNIYDLAGNARDWTMEAFGYNDRVCRGGYYTYNGINSPASNREYYPTLSYSSNGARTTLYIK